RIYLPPAASVMTARAAERPERLGEKRGWETVLIVEDDDAVRALSREVLRRYGYVVLEARHGLDALRIAERHPDEIHLLVTDVVLPHMGGREVAERLTSVRPKMRV